MHAKTWRPPFTLSRPQPGSVLLLTTAGTVAWHLPGWTWRTDSTIGDAALLVGHVWSVGHAAVEALAVMLAAKKL